MKMHAYVLLMFSYPSSEIYILANALTFMVTYNFKGMIGL